MLNTIKWLLVDDHELF